MFKKSVLAENSNVTTDLSKLGPAGTKFTHDFFLSDIPWDSYNIDRIDISRGPNAILFAVDQFFHNMRIGDMCARHTNQVEHVLRYGVTCARKVSDFCCMEHRQRHFSFERGYRGQPRR